MIKNSNIEWTGSSWNPWRGCVKKTIQIGGEVKLREECRNCYMYREQKRYGRRPELVVRAAPDTFNKPLKVQKEVEKGLRPNFLDWLMFTCSWSDWNNPESDAWRPEAWEIVRQCPDLIFQILTKLPQRMNDHLPPFWDEIKDRCWVGVSCGYQEAADQMIPELLKIPATIRFLSCEPLLGPLNLLPFMYPKFQLENTTQGYLLGEPAVYKTYGLSRRDIHWVIAGGESGPGARPCHPNWVRSLRDQCQASGVAFFFKQWGEFIPKTETHFWDDEKGWMRKDEWIDVLSRPGKWGCLDIHGKYLEGTTTWNGRQNDERDDFEVTVYKVGKAAAGRLLDGQEWSEFPAVAEQAGER